jgi:glycosyltransferase involved in cell wall biosynthesis
MIKQHEMPLTSIVIIGKNEQDTIESCIMSIFNQTYPDFEIIYVDDNSSDDTMVKAQRFKNIVPNKNCKRYEVVSASTGYPSKNRNIGSKIAKGTVIAFIDADCIAEPDWLFNLISRLPNESGVVGGPLTLMHKKNSNITKAIDSVLSSFLGSGGSAQFYEIKEDSQIAAVPAGNMAIHKHLLEKLGGFNEKLRYNEDSFLCYTARNLGFKIYFSAKARVCHYIDIDSYSDFVSYFRQYGFARGINVRRDLNLLGKFNLLSLGLIFSGVSLLILSFFSSTAAVAFVCLIILILSVEFAYSLKLATAHGSVKLFFMFSLFFMSLHIMYNLGFIHGLISYRYKLR